MKRQIEFPITARVTITEADQHVPLIEAAAKAALEIEQLVNATGKIRIHVSLDRHNMPKQVNQTCPLPHKYGEAVCGRDCLFAGRDK